MTLSIREQVLEAFKNTLSSISGIDRLTVERNRVAPVQDFPKLVMRDGGQEVTEENTGMMGYRMTVDVEGYVAYDKNSNPGTDINSLYGAVVEGVLADRTLGGLAFDITETGLDLALDNMPGNAAYAAFNVTFTVDYYTTPGDPYSLAP